MGNELMKTCCSNRETTDASAKILKPIILDSKYKQLSEQKEEKTVQITFLHWNVLADKLVDSFPKVPKKFLEWDYRFNLMK